MLENVVSLVFQQSDETVNIFSFFLQKD